MKGSSLVIIAAVLAAAFAVAGCAKHPGQIGAIQMDKDAYRDLNCRQLLVHEAEIRHDLEAVSYSQTSAASADAIGVLFLGVPFGSLTGEDKEALIAVAKGRLNAIEIVKLEKDCR